MSEETVKETSVAAETPQEPVAQEPVKQTPPPKLLKVYGREFDLSTDQGLLQAQTWSEAMSTLVGKQSTEIGELRRFKSERDQMPKGYDEVLEKASELRDNGDHKAADRMMLNWTQEQKVAADRKLALERENDRTWDAYYEARPDLVKLFGRDKIRAVSEQTLGIYDAEDPFRVLDAFWKPRGDMLTPRPADATQATKPENQKPREDLPPASLSGGPARPAPNAAPVAKTETFDDVLNAYHSKFNKR